MHGGIWLQPDVERSPAAADSDRRPPSIISRPPSFKLFQAFEGRWATDDGRWAAAGVRRYGSQLRDGRWARSRGRRAAAGVRRYGSQLRDGRWKTNERRAADPRRQRWRALLDGAPTRLERGDRRDERAERGADRH
ncbi:hypothetical protein PF004_g15839 [Phytophthora fragariae]|uniref:Uncharacterized protein n=1 Tax=Phytophthora fragariae TaxID=53985 RepID=A0A6G0NK78_9STRA|nr:hypothetical protein PF004_g15839 [Phytophthora fragariae]